MHRQADLETLRRATLPAADSRRHGLDDRSQIDRPMPMPPDLVVKKAFEQLVGILGGQSDTAVCYRDQNLTNFVLMRSDRQLRRSIRGGLHRFNTVDDEIEVTCCSWIPIAETRHRPGASSIAANTRWLSSSRCKQVITSLTTSLIVQRRLLAGGLVYQSTERWITSPADYVIDNRLEGAVRFLQVGSFAVEPRRAAAALATTAAERLVYLMGDRCGQFPRAVRA